MDDYQLALAHYRLQFPDLPSLGVLPSAPAWKAEYDRVAASGFNAILLTSSTMGDGIGNFAQRNFDQKALLGALHQRRSELDRAYRQLLRTPAQADPQPAGSIIRLGF